MKHGPLAVSVRGRIWISERGRIEAVFSRREDMETNKYGLSRYIPVSVKKAVRPYGAIRTKSGDEV
jgi:hypothetical protein